MRVEGEKATVLVTVKATPQPSTKYGETVCVAGLRIDTPTPEWIRLYPVAFRWLAGDQQFKKYDVIEVEVRRVDRDTRRESYSPTHDAELRVIDHYAPWTRRIEVLSQVAATTTCELVAAAREHHAAPSLGIVYPADIDELKFEPHPPWSPEERKKIQDRIDAEASSLFSFGEGLRKIFEAPRFKAIYHYRCDDTKCSGHRGRLLDWELTSLEAQYRADDELQRAVSKKFFEQMGHASRQTGFFMGNFEAPIKRDKFSVLGVYWPKASEAASPSTTLF